MKLSRIYMPLVCLLASLGQSCSDELDMPRPWEDDSVVSLRIPSPQGAFRYGQTRADGEGPDVDRAAAILKEAYINDVTLYAFKADPDDNTAETKKFVLTGPTGSNPSTATDYLTYELQLKPGSYRFYMLANAAGYIATLPGEDEAAVKQLVLSFGNKKPTTSDKKGSEEGLPMGCLPTDFQGADADGVISTKAVSGRTLYAEPIFLCSKVRTTLLFDNTEETGFSYPGFGNAMLDLSGMSVSGSPANTAFYPEENKDLALGTLTEFTVEPANCVWPADADTYPRLSDGASAPDLAGFGGSFGDNDHQRAWQTTSYLPENLTATKTLLTFKGSQSGAPAKYPLQVPVNEAGLKRSFFYDIVGRIKSAGAEDIEFETKVMEWDVQNLVYELHGRFVLEVESTEMQVFAGMDNILGVHSDTQVRIHEKSPTYPVKVDGVDVEVPLYLGTFRNDSLIVTLNPQVPLGADLLEDDGVTPKSDYNHFYIAAGNLLKKINVTRLSADAYLNVTPTNIMVDLREYIASGVNEKSIAIEFGTNMPNLEVTVDNDGTAVPVTDSRDGKYLHWLIGKEEMEISLGLCKEGETSGTYYLQYAGMSNGGEFWKDSHTITMTFKATGENRTITRTVTINVLPMTSSYTIYFKAPADWSCPHIYAYQCLEFPADLTGEAAKYAGMPCGKDAGNAALEYLFSTDMAFRGWAGYGGSDANTLPPGNGWSENTDNGFYINNGYWLYDNGKLNTDRYEYVDFNTGADVSKCGDCANQGYRNHQWAGIAMTEAPEFGEQWYKYTLSGLATPGKCLLMFASAHGGNGLAQVPGSGKVGIALFDFPDRTGYIDGTQYDSEKDNRPSFVNTPPTVQPVEYTYYLHGDFTASNSWYTTKMTELSDGRWQTTINVTNGSANFGIKRLRDGESISDANFWITAAGSNITPGKDIPCKQDGTNFTVTGAGKYVFTFNPTDMTLDVTKDGSYEIITKDYRIYWASDIECGDVKKIHIWPTGGDSFTSWNTQNANTDSEYSGYYYYDFSSSDSKDINVILAAYDGNNNDTSHQKRFEPLANMSAFTYDEKSGRYCYTIDSASTTYPGTPKERQDVYSWSIYSSSNGYVLAAMNVGSDGRLSYDVDTRNTLQFNLVYLKNGTKYQTVYADGNDGTLSLGTAKKAVVKDGDNGSNFTIAGGKYHIVFDPNAMTVTVTGETYNPYENYRISVAGGHNEWNTGDAPGAVPDSNGIAVFNVQVGNNEFKLRINKGDGYKWYKLSSETVEINKSYNIVDDTDGSSNLKIAGASSGQTFQFTVDVKNNTVIIK